MSNIVLVNPPPKQIIEDHDKPDYPHIGIGYIASSLESHGFPPIVLDAKLERLSIDMTVKRILSLSPIIVGITAMTHEINYAHELAAKIKSSRNNIIIVIGGVHVSALPERTLREFSDFDIGVVGEGEHTIVELCEHILKKKKGIADIPGTVFRLESGEVRLASQRPFIKDLDSLNPPAWHLFPRAVQYPIITARGCPAQCIFCAHSYGYVLRERSPENIIMEWKGIINHYSPQQIMIMDESFGINKKRAFDFLNMIIDQSLIVPWIGWTRANTASMELMSKMKEAGCTSVGIGIETGDPDILKTLKKGITLEQARHAITNIHKAGMQSDAFFILGCPNETIRTIWRTIRFAASLRPTTLALGIMVPYPGTEIASMAESGEGGYKKISNDWKDFNKQIGNALELNNLSRRKLEFFQFLGYVYVFLSRGRIKDFLRFSQRNRTQAIGFLKHFLNFRRKTKDQTDG